MGDYSQGHFRFALKADTPKEIKDTLDSFVRGQPFEISGMRIYPGDSAYHRMPVFLGSDYPELDETYKAYCLTFQIKYGCQQMDVFASWLSPHIIVNRSNKGFFGYSISEYTDTPTVYFAPYEEKDKLLASKN